MNTSIEPGYIYGSLEFRKLETQDPRIWKVVCSCGRKERASESALRALDQLGINLACSKCRLRRPTTAKFLGPEYD